MKNWDKTEPMLDDELFHRQKIEGKNCVFIKKKCEKNSNAKENLKKK